MKLLPDIAWSELHIEHGGVDVGVAHEVHERRERDSAAGHVRSEGMAKSMGFALAIFDRRR